MTLREHHAGVARVAALSHVDACKAWLERRLSDCANRDREAMGCEIGSARVNFT